MTIFEMFLALLITAFLILFCISLIAAYTNYKSIMRLYKLFDILRERQERDFRQMQKYYRGTGRGMKGVANNGNGKSK